MCGINGIIRVNDPQKARTSIVLMNGCLKHRGPDDEGVYADDFASLGQRRLAIIDLSEAGHQPMFSHDSSIAIVFNGEIYNFRDIKAELQDYDFVTHTDTEVIIAAYQKWGISFIEKLDGMFAIALYDKVLQAVFLIRDRLGVKPLYYYESPEKEVYFSSEIRGIAAIPGFKKELNSEAIHDYLSYQTVAGQSTLLKNVLMLEAGTYARIDKSGIEKKNYWKPRYQTRTDIPYDNAVKDVRELFFRAVEKRLMSDVPLGTFLSGGIDSSAIVAAMSECGIRPATFNVNFTEGKFSEAHYARIVAKKFNTRHTEINLKEDYFLGLLPAAVNALDHPSIDGLNTYIVSRATKEAGITVALSGVGGDEWFAGYPVFKRLHENALGRFKLVPRFLRAGASAALSAIMQDDSKAKKFRLLASQLGNRDLYMAERMLFTPAQIHKLLKKDPGTNAMDPGELKNIPDLSIAEWEYYLMPVLLRDTDQMGMAHSLEIREPFLDYKLIEYLLALPDAYKFGPKPKQLLVSAMGDLLPDEIVTRPKMGFVLPYEVWMKKELGSFVREGLSALKGHKAFNETGISALENNYFSGRNGVRWTMIWSLSVLGHWIKNNQIE
jgi:asparagine synthase (glutamine-hydrolysing)